MEQNSTPQSIPVEGHFRRTKQSTNWIILVAIVVISGGAVIGVGIMMESTIVIGGALIVLAILLVLSWRRQQRQIVNVRLADDKLIIDGGGYRIHLQAPFRYQTGIQRIRATSRTPEFYYVRMVLDVFGRPLVFEEQVAPGSHPPKLDEITGIASALGIAELTSSHRFPGTLWAIIQSFEAMSSATNREQIKRDIENLYRIGGQQLHDNSYYGAIQTFSEIIRLTPDSHYPYYNRGMAHFYRGQELDKAIRDLTTAIRLKPSFAKAYWLRAMVYTQQGDWESVRDDCTVAIKLNPQDTGLYNMRGGACYRLQDYQSALADFDRAIKLDSTNPEPYHNRGLVRQRLGNLDGAIADYSYALQLNPMFEPAQISIQLAEQEKRQLGLS